MAQLWDRIKNVWQDNLTDGESVEAETRQARVQGRDDIARVVSDRLAELREEIRHNWIQDAIDLPSDARAEINARHLGKVDVYNDILDSLHQQSYADRISYEDLPEVIHPEAMAQRVSDLIEREIVHRESIREAAREAALERIPTRTKDRSSEYEASMEASI